jgi:type VI protein secretion system component VasK
MRLAAAAVFAGVAAFMGAAASAQQAAAPVEDLRPADAPLMKGQQRAEAAYRALRQSEYDAKLAEQDWLNARDAHRTAQQRAEELKRQEDAAKKTLDTAQGRVAALRAAHDKEVDAVDGLSRKKP